MTLESAGQQYSNIQSSSLEFKKREDRILK